MELNDIKQITVVGSGLMGSQIAMVCALANFKVIIHDIDKDNLNKAKDSLEQIMNRRVEKGRNSAEEVENAFSKLSFETDLKNAVSETDFVIEAIVEKVEVKQALFKQLDEYAPKHAILATNSSMIVSSKLAPYTSRQDKVCNFHFFNPALIMELIEVVKGEHTSDETVSVAMALAKKLNKTPIQINKEILGFVTNRILMSIFDEAIYLYENGYASLEEIDIACKKGLNHPIGPFALLDLTGVDLNYHIKQYIYQETGDENEKPQKSLKDLYEEGAWGRKSGTGFYEYN